MQSRMDAGLTGLGGCFGIVVFALLVLAILAAHQLGIV